VGSRLAVHFGRSGILPPRELIDPHVERTDNHWYWLLEFYDDNLDRTAIFPWAPPAESPSRFVVARLLWCWANDGVGIKRLQLENTCGLATCINPSHWRYIRSTVSGNVALPIDADAYLVRYGAIHDDMKSSGSALRSTHIVRHDNTYTVCGVSTKNLCSTDDPLVTCKTCVVEWRRSGAMLLEVKPP
jgi:hypothetical protein